MAIKEVCLGFWTPNMDIPREEERRREFRSEKCARAEKGKNRLNFKVQGRHSSETDKRGSPKN